MSRAWRVSHRIAAPRRRARPMTFTSGSNRSMYRPCSGCSRMTKAGLPTKARTSDARTRSIGVASSGRDIGSPGSLNARASADASAITSASAPARVMALLQQDVLEQRQPLAARSRPRRCGRCAGAAHWRSRSVPPATHGRGSAPCRPPDRRGPSTARRKADARAWSPASISSNEPCASDSEVRARRTRSCVACTSSNARTHGDPPVEGARQRASYRWRPREGQRQRAGNDEDGKHGAHEAARQQLRRCPIRCGRG